MDRKNIGNAVREPTPNSKPIDSNGGFMALTAPNGPGGHSANPPQNSTPTGYDSSTAAHNLTPTSQYGPAIAGSQFESLNFHSTSEPFLQNRANLRYQPKIQTQYRPNLQYHPNIQNQPNSHYQPMAQHNPIIQNVNLLVGTSPAANNTPTRTQHQRQMFGDPHSTPIASRVNVNQAMQSARASVMAQQAQQAQQAAHEKKVLETVQTLKGLKKKGKIDFGDHIHSFSDAALFEEAEQRMNMKLTPQLAEDFPKDLAQQGVLARDLADVLQSWKTRVQPGASKGAIKRIKSKEEILILLNAWKIMVINSRSLMWPDSS